jgi:hypothetical protein
MKQNPKVVCTYYVKKEKDSAQLREAFPLTSMNFAHKFISPVVRDAFNESHFGLE